MDSSDANFPIACEVPKNTTFSHRWRADSTYRQFSIRERDLQLRPGVSEPHEYGALYARTNFDGERMSKPKATPAKKVEAMSGRTPVATQPVFDSEEFRQFLEHAASIGAGQPPSLKMWLEYAEAWQITRARRRCRGNRSATARELGIGRRTLYAKMEKLGITASWGV